MLNKDINITIIGAGKIAYSFTPALINSGYKFTSVISRNINSAEKLAKKYLIPNYSDDYENILPQSNLFIICTPDSELKNAVQKLSRLNLRFKESLFIHLSGAENISVLRPLNKLNGKTASLHIMQSFPSKKRVKISGCYCSIETDNKEVLKFLEKLSEKLGMVSFIINSESKEIYHLAGVFISNFLSGNMFAAKFLFENQGINKKDPVKITGPIASSTIANIKKLGPEKSLSGPVERGDVSTIKRHLQALKKSVVNDHNDLPNLILLSYIGQSLLLLEAVKLKYGSLTGKHEEIKILLNTELKKYTGSF